MSKKILIAEDDELLAKSLAVSLEDSGYNVFSAYDGEEALFLAEKNLPDLILLDINMPKMDGLSMLKEMRSTSWGKNIKVIILTNLNDESRVLEALKNSVFSYLVKSDWDLDRIIKKVSDELGS